MASACKDGMAASISRKQEESPAGFSKDERAPPTSSSPSAPDPSVTTAAADSSADDTSKTKRIIIVPNCRHESVFIRYLRPCPKCNVFCNCGLSFSSSPFPDVLVRSLDKKIVRLSKHLVQASETLRGLVSRLLFFDRKGKMPIPRENIVLETAPNQAYIINRFRRPKQQEMREVLRLLKARSEGDEEGVIYNPPENLLVLFDVNNSVPTFGVSKEALLKMNEFICKHLDQMDARVAAKIRRDRFFEDRPPSVHMSLEDSGKMINTFEYDDWEAEFFFNLDTIQYLELHQANQELLIRDFFFSLEKWVLLWRGFPVRMVNGHYESYNDPDYDNSDNYTVFGIYNLGYTNPKRKRNRKYLTKRPNPLDILMKELLGHVQWWKSIPKA